MSNGFVTFKERKTSGNETVLRGIEATKHLAAAAGAEFAWPVVFSGGTPPNPNSEVFFRVHPPYDETNIRRLETISEQDFEQSKASKKVARFYPQKDFQQAAQEAANRR